MCVCVCCQTAAAGPALSGQLSAGAAAPQQTEAAHAGAGPGQSSLYTSILHIIVDSIITLFIDILFVKYLHIICHTFQTC